MKNLRFKSAVAALAATLAIGATTVYAQHEGGKHGRGGDRMEMMMHGKLAEKLNLTADQKTKLQEMWKTFKESNKATHEQIKQNQKQLHEMMKSDNYNRATTEQLIKQNSELQAKMKLAMLDKMQEMKKILTPEQLAKFKELRTEREGKMKDRRENRKEKRELRKDNDRNQNSREKSID
ncbi:MAG: Spy/CpxP family protein refolding chaperone [Bacteroidota bacterium]